MNKSNASFVIIAVLFITITSAGAAVIALPVPETGTTLGLLGIGLVAVAGLRHKFRR